MFHTRPGTYFHYLRKPAWVNSRTWAALEFRIEAVDTDVDRSWWVIVLEVFLGVLTVGVATLYIEGLVSAAGKNFSGRVKAAKPGAPASRVRRTIPPPGGVGVRIGVDQFDITADGTYVGISVRPFPTPVALLGPTTVPSTYAGDTLRYLVRLPSGVTADDPALRVRWTLDDRTNSIVLADQDGAAGRSADVRVIACHIRGRNGLRRGRTPVPPAGPDRHRARDRVPQCAPARPAAATGLRPLAHAGEQPADRSRRGHRRMDVPR